MVREAALKHDIYATFMAKPMATEPGSAKHIHQERDFNTDGSNVFATNEGEYSQAVLSLFGGLAKIHALDDESSLPLMLILTAALPGRFLHQSISIGGGTTAPRGFACQMPPQELSHREPLSLAPTSIPILP